MLEAKHAVTASLGSGFSPEGTSPLSLVEAVPFTPNHSGNSQTERVYRLAAGNYEGMTNYAYDGGRPTVGQAGAQQVGLEEQLSRLDKLEQVISAERERLNRPSADSRDQPGRRSGDQYDPRSGDQQEPVDTLREVDVPGLETKVTESQREAGAIGLAMRTTQRRSTEQPALVGRITEHLNELQQVVDQTRCTIPARAADPGDGPLVW
jgi:hypothetical protein